MTYAALTPILCCVKEANCYSADFIRSRELILQDQSLCEKWPKMQALVFSLFTEKEETEKLPGVQ